MNYRYRAMTQDGQKLQGMGSFAGEGEILR